tara:strand:- start:231 stop:761 length:531 start_codon:yes stop_codon:yes gene_type:complete
MPYDTSNLPIGGMTIIAFLIYALISLFVMGPTIGERTVQQSDWGATCRSSIRAEISAQKEPPTIIPRTDCQSVLGGFLPELGALCRQYGNPDFGGPMSDVLREQERARQAAEERRLENAAAKSGSACECAASLFLEEERVALAIYAGSARQITPPAIKSMKNSLSRALNSPLCAMK